MTPMGQKKKEPVHIPDSLSNQSILRSTVCKLPGDRRTRNRTLQFMDLSIDPPWSLITMSLAVKFEVIL